MLWAVLAAGIVASLAAQTTGDTLPTSIREATRARLEALLGTYGKALGMRWSRNAKEPFNIVAYYDRDLRYTARFEVVMSITRQNTIGFRAYPVPHLNIDDARDPSGLMRKMLRLSEQNFLFWAADGSQDIYAGSPSRSSPGSRKKRSRSCSRASRWSTGMWGCCSRS